jgi:hypothetical protein
LAGVVSDGTAAVISAAVKAVVRNIFIRLSSPTVAPGTIIWTRHLLNHRAPIEPLKRIKNASQSPLPAALN